MVKWWLGAWIWLGGNIPAVSGGASGDVVALQSGAGFPLQVPLFLFLYIKILELSLTRTKFNI